MGISCSVLFKENSFVEATKMYSILQKNCEKRKFYFDVNQKEIDSSNRIKLIRTNISDKPFWESISRQLNVDVYDEPYEYKDISFDWYDDEPFFEAVVIDWTEGNEDLLFLIVLDFLSAFPETLLWIEEDWFYHLKDLKKIDNEPFDDEWCYKNPELEKKIH